MPHKNDKLHQLNVTYSGTEDRLLLRASTRHGDEYRVWLTRRFTAMLLNIMIKEMDKYGGSAALGANPRTRALFKSGAMEKAYEGDKTTNFPLGKNGFLAYTIKTTKMPDGNLHLEILPKKGKGVSVNLDKQLLYMFHNLLTQGIARAEWHLVSSQEPQSGRVH
ncbi:MAG: hypothetical protein ACRESK_03040 [Gammaproteobacteria bacterium]